MKSWAEREARRISKARTLLSPAIDGAGGMWADAGCGDGIFTYLLCTLLTLDSQIYAIDKNRGALQAVHRNLSQNCTRISVHTLQADFTKPLSIPLLDGLVMANALHFVKKKKPVLAQLVNLLKPGGRLVVIEYNTTRGNLAVPHPFDEAGFLTLASEVGLRRAKIVAKPPSTFLGEMYTGVGMVH